MICTTKVNRESHIKLWIDLWNGNLNLTGKEKEFLYEILFSTMTIIDDGVSEPYLSKLIFERDNIKSIMAKLKLTKQTYHAYKKSLIAKGVLIENDNLSLNPRLIPQIKVTFKFNYG